MCGFSVQQEEVVLPEIVVVRGDEHVGTGSLQPLAQEVPPLTPLLELLLAVGVVAAHTLGTAALQPGGRGGTTLFPLYKHSITTSTFFFLIST